MSQHTPGTQGIGPAEAPPAPAEVEVPTTPRARRRLSRGQLTFRRFLRNRTAVAGAVVIALLTVTALLGPQLFYWKFDDIDYDAFLTGPDANHLLGTTQAGRDVLALTLRGMGKSPVIGFMVALLSTTIAALARTAAGSRAVTIANRIAVNTTAATAVRREARNTPGRIAAMACPNQM